MYSCVNGLASMIPVIFFVLLYGLPVESQRVTTDQTPGLRPPRGRDRDPGRRPQAGRAAASLQVRSSNGDSLSLRLTSAISDGSSPGRRRSRCGVQLASGKASSSQCNCRLCQLPPLHAACCLQAWRPAVTGLSCATRRTQRHACPLKSVILLDSSIHVEYSSIIFQIKIYSTD
jgi:hypothetical protein